MAEDTISSKKGWDYDFMKWLNKFIKIEKGRLFAEIIAIIIIFALAIFTPLQSLDFSLKIFIIVGIIMSSVWLMRWIEPHFT